MSGCLPRKPQCPWEIKLLLHCPLEDQSAKGKGFGKLLGELVFVEFFSERIFVPLDIPVPSGTVWQRIPDQGFGSSSNQGGHGAGKTQPGMPQGKSNTGKSSGKVTFENSIWGRKIKKEITQKPKCRKTNPCPGSRGFP